MSKSNISNGETQSEVDAIDNNNEWKVRNIPNILFSKLILNLFFYFFFLLIILGS